MELVLNRLTTNYTFFMREKEHLDVFCKRIIPDIVRRHQRDKCLAIWSAGCSSGEEPYNITMFLYDYLGPQAKQWDTRILATDISQKALATAKKGVYEVPNTVPDAWRTTSSVFFSPKRSSCASALPITSSVRVSPTSSSSMRDGLRPAP